MTATHVASPLRAAANARSLSGLLHPTTQLSVLLCALLAFGCWMLANRPAQPADFAGQVAGLAFSPFHRGQSPERGSAPTAEEIRGDLRLASETTGRIRTYTVAGELGAIPSLAASLPLRITLGAWLDRSLSGNQAELTRLIGIARAHRNVEAVLVGNETLLRGDLTPSQLLADIKAVKQALSVPVSTAEPWHVWLAHPELAAAVDVMTIHLLPYWEGLPVDRAIDFMLNKLAAVHAAYPGKPIVIGEVGWPSDGVAIGGARASRINQAQFLRQFLVIAQQRHLQYFVMEAFDQPWKTSFEGRAAGYWGMFDLDRHAKWSLTGKVWETPSWPSWAFGSTALAAMLTLLLLSQRPDMRLPGKLLLAALTQGFAAAFTAVLLAMSSKYLSSAATAVWSLLAVGQGLVLLLLVADSFELTETIWGRVWHRRLTAPLAPPGASLPKVSIHLAICNEPPRMVRQTLDALAALDYPNFEVLVIDNNTTDPALWEPVAEHCARLGARFRFFHLGKWPGFKAGALNFALGETCRDAEIVGVLDSDYLVSPDWLRAMAPLFADPGVGFVQSPQDYRDNDGSFFKRLMFWEYAGFFQLGMVTRNERNAIIQHGTMTLVRKPALQHSGGWAEWTITEDAELGLRLFRHGWRAIYVPQSFGRGVMPDDFDAYRRQRSRWAYGAMQICRGHWRALFSPFNRELTLGQRWHFVTGWLPWLGDALGLLFLLMGLVWSIGLIMAPMRYEFPIVLFMLPSIFLFIFKLVQISLLYRNRVQCGAWDRLGAAVAGLALSHTIGKAVWKGLVVPRAPFCRTPKLADAPALVQGLWMAREELCLFGLTWAAMLGVGFAQHLATWEARLWCVVLLTQSLPYLAAVVTSVVAALPAPRPADRVRSAPGVPTAAIAGGD